MIHKNGKQTNERRKHRRFTVIGNIVEPIVLRYAPEKGAKTKKTKDSVPVHLHTQPAILTDLSAGGISLITFLAPPHAKVFKMTLTVPGLNHLAIEGKVVRVTKKGETYIVGIQFTKIAKKFQLQISRMADDDADCNTRASLGLPEVCVSVCRFHSLCTKTQKAPFWPRRV